MYIPPAFGWTDPKSLSEFLEAHRFGLLVSQVGGRLTGTHLPWMVEKRGDEPIALVGHLARANPQWQELEQRESLVVFSGPHAYISPAWYEAENVVPTWNYVVVHVYGTARLIVDPDELMKVVSELVQTLEASYETPWVFDATTAFARNLVRSIVGFRLAITRIEGKAKLGQNHPRERQEKVVRALGRQDDDNSRQIAAWMARRLEPQ